MVFDIETNRVKVKGQFSFSNLIELNTSFPVLGKFATVFFSYTT